MPGWGGAVSRHEDDLVRADGDGDRRAGLEPGDCDAQSQSAPRNDSGLDRHAIHEVGLADELGDEPRPRPLEEILRSPDLDDAASVEDGDAVRDHHGLPLVVSDVKGRDGEGRVKSSNLEAHFFAKVCIEVAQRLVEEEDLRLHHQRPSHRDPLLLAAGEFPRIARLVAAELDDPQHVLDARLALGLRHARLEPQAVGDVLGHGHVGPEGVALEDHRHAPPLGRHDAGRRGKASLAHPDLAGLRTEESRDQTEGRRLAAPGGPEERDELAGLDFQTESFHRGDVAVALGQPFDRHPGHRASLTPSPR